MEAARQDRLRDTAVAERLQREFSLREAQKEADYRAVLRQAQDVADRKAVEREKVRVVLCHQARTEDLGLDKGEHTVR